MTTPSRHRRQLVQHRAPPSVHLPAPQLAAVGIELDYRPGSPMLTVQYVGGCLGHSRQNHRPILTHCCRRDFSEVALVTALRFPEGVVGEGEMRPPNQRSKKAGKGAREGGTTNYLALVYFASSYQVLHIFSSEYHHMVKHRVGQ